MPELALSSEEKSKIESLFSDYGTLGHDTWGTSLRSLLMIAPFIKFLYEKYFRVSVKGLEKIPDSNALFIANHGGQIPVDGMMVGYTLLTKAPKVRLVRGMVERWVPTLPFIGSFFMKIGQVVGDQKNCAMLLENGQSVLVFPEGVKGSGKTIQHRYQLQKFGTGFYRLAIETKVPIVPVVLVGTEETYPAFHDGKAIAKKFGFPYFPITPTFPLLGIFGAIPIPTKISIKFLDPIYPSLSKEATDKEVTNEIDRIQFQMQEAIREGLQKRGNDYFTGEAF